MSRGTQIVPVRLSQQLRDELHLAIASRNRVTRESPWCVSDFIREAIRAKLDHNARSRSAQRRKRSAPSSGAKGGVA